MIMMMRKVALWIGVAVVLGWSSGASALPSNNPITAGLVAAYEFTGNADDVSGNGNNGVVNGATLTADRFGNAGSAYSFDGVDDYIAMPSPISGHAEFTSSLWLNIGPVELANPVPGHFSFSKRLQKSARITEWSCIGRSFNFWRSVVHIACWHLTAASLHHQRY